MSHASLSIVLMADLVAVAFVCRHQPRLAAHGHRLSTLLDASPRYSRAQALASGSVSLLQRVLAREASTVEPLELQHWTWATLKRVVRDSPSLQIVHCLLKFVHPSRSLWDVVGWAVQTKHITLFQWLYAHAATQQRPTQEIQDVLLREAVVAGDISILRWILDHRDAKSAKVKAKPVDLGAIIKGLSASTVSQWEIVDLLVERLGVLPHRSLPVLAAKCGRLETLRKIRQHVSPTPVIGVAASNAAASMGHFDIVDWLGVSPTSDAIDDAALEGEVGVLQQLHSRFGCEITPVAVLRAADKGHLTSLEWMRETFAAKPLWNDLDGLLMPAFTAAVERGHLGVVRWLYETRLRELLGSKEPKERRIVKAVSVYLAFQYNHLPVIQFLHTHGLMDWDNWEGGNAAFYCDLPTILWLHGNDLMGEPRNELTSAVYAGRLDCIEWILANRPTEPATYAVEYAALHGRMDVLALLLRHGLKGSFRAIDYAASKGHIEILRHLVANRQTALADENNEASVTAIHSACLAGHLEVVQFLTENPVRGGTCTTTAMDSAASKGFFEIVQYLHEHRREGCTVFAMDSAAANGDMAIVKFLHEHRSEGCSPAGPEGAAVNGHLDMVKFLIAHYPHVYTPKLVQRARAKGELEIALWLEQSSAALAITSRRQSRSANDSLLPPATPIVV